MKNIKYSHTIARLFLGCAALILAISAIPAQAQLISTPSYRSIPYSLAAGQVSTLIALPPRTPVSVTATQDTVGWGGVAQVTLLSVPGNWVEWVGLDSPSNLGSGIVQGYNGAIGTHIVWIDYGHKVEIQVASPTAIRVRNTDTGPRTGRITLMW